MTVTWSASTLSNGAPVDAYLIRRYDAANLALQSVGAGCAGVVVLPSCVETAVPAGQWVYSVTPVFATNWRGPESVKSSPVAIAGPTLALSSTRVKPGSSLVGTASGFLAGETLRYRLDSPTGTELIGTLAGNGTPALVPAGGGGSVSVTVPSGIPDGAHKVYAVASPSGDAVSADILVDGTAPPAPLLTQTPTNPSGDSVTFAFTEAEPGAAVQCSLDGAAYAPCDSPVSYAELASGSHTFQARATDTVGNISPVTSYAWSVNLTIPTVSIGFPVMGGAYNDTGFTAGCGTPAGDVCGYAEDDAAVLATNISLRRISTGLYWNGVGFASATETWLPAFLASSDWSYAINSASLPEGDYTLRAQASDGANLGYDARTFTVDQTAPTAPAVTVPPPPTSGPSVNIEFTTGDQSASFECRLDSGSWGACSSPKRYDNLTDGSHTVELRAMDRAGNLSGATSRTWTVDAIAPSAAVSFPSPGRYNRAGWATGCDTPTTGDICGSANDVRSGLAGVAVSIRRAATNSYWDGSAFASASETWLTATGTTSWRYLLDSNSFPADGSYMIRWRATDNVGNTTTASIDLTIDNTAPPAPVIVQAPHDPAGTSAQFDFTIAETGTVSQCRLDSGSWTTCTAPIGYSGLEPGTHTFDVRALDTAGNLSTTTSYSWSVDTGIPSVTLSSPAGGRTYNDSGYNAGCGSPTTGDICGTASDPQGNLAAVDISIQRASTQLYWNGTSFSSSTEVNLPVVGSTSWSYALPAAAFPGDESFTMRARATDDAGLTSSDSVTISFDRTAPAAPTISSGPTGTTSGGDTFTFTGESGAHFECQLDGGTWASCTSPKTHASLTDGSHMFRVRAVDAAGNTGASTSRTWIVDATAPAISTTFPAVGGRYNNTTYDAGCVGGTGDICGTTTDAPAGVAKVELSIQRASTGLYLSGTTFSSAAQAWITASGTTSWNYALAASTFPADGTYTLTVRATDTVGNARTSSTAYIIDRTKPTATGFTTSNLLTARKLEAGDTYTLTFSEPVAPGSIIAGWNGITTQNVIVQATGKGGSKQDRLAVYNATGGILLPLGSVNLKRTDYVTDTVTFTASKLVMNGSSLTITLGTPSNSTRIGTAAAAANASWTPSASTLDLAGNTAATTIFTEVDNDNDF